MRALNAAGCRGYCVYLKGIIKRSGPSPGGWTLKTSERRDISYSLVDSFLKGFVMLYFFCVYLGLWFGYWSY